MEDLKAKERYIDPEGSGFPSLATVNDYAFVPFYSTYRPHVDVAFEYAVSRG